MTDTMLMGGTERVKGVTEWRNERIGIGQLGKMLPPADVMPAETLLIANVVDDSRSMFHRRQALVEGVNALTYALREARAAQGIYLSMIGLNGGVYFPLLPLAEVPKLLEHEYHPRGNTPLYEVSLKVLMVIESLVEGLQGQDVNATGHVCLSSDGLQNNSFRDASEDDRRRQEDYARQAVHEVATRMLNTENHVIMAIGYGEDTTGNEQFRQIFQGMGVPPNQILVPEAGYSTLRQAYGAVSEAAVRGAGGDDGNSSMTAFMR